MGDSGHVFTDVPLTPEQQPLLAAFHNTTLPIGERYNSGERLYNEGVVINDPLYKAFARFLEQKGIATRQASSAQTRAKAVNEISKEIGKQPELRAFVVEAVVARGGFAMIRKKLEKNKDIIEHVNILRTTLGLPEPAALHTPQPAPLVPPAPTDEPRIGTYTLDARQARVARYLTKRLQNIRNMPMKKPRAKRAPARPRPAPAIKGEAPTVLPTREKLLKRNHRQLLNENLSVADRYIAGDVLFENGFTGQSAVYERFGYFKEAMYHLLWLTQEYMRINYAAYLLVLTAYFNRRKELDFVDWVRYYLIDLDYITKVPLPQNLKDVLLQEIKKDTADIMEPEAFFKRAPILVHYSMDPQRLARFNPHSPPAETFVIGRELLETHEQHYSWFLATYWEWWYLCNGLYAHDPEHADRYMHTDCDRASLMVVLYNHCESGDRNFLGWTSMDLDEHKNMHEVEKATAAIERDDVRASTQDVLQRLSGLLTAQDPHELSVSHRPPEKKPRRIKPVEAVKEPEYSPPSPQPYLNVFSTPEDEEVEYVPLPPSISIAPAAVEYGKLPLEPTHMTTSSGAPPVARKPVTPPPPAGTAETVQLSPLKQPAPVAASPKKKYRYVPALGVKVEVKPAKPKPRPVTPPLRRAETAETIQLSPIRPAPLDTQIAALTKQFISELAPGQHVVQATVAPPPLPRAATTRSGMSPPPPKKKSREDQDSLPSHVSAVTMHSRASSKAATAALSSQVEQMRQLLLELAERVKPQGPPPAPPPPPPPIVEYVPHPAAPQRLELWDHVTYVRPDGTGAQAQIIEVLGGEMYRIDIHPDPVARDRLVFVRKYIGPSQVVRSTVNAAQNWWAAVTNAAQGAFSFMTVQGQVWHDLSDEQITLLREYMLTVNLYNKSIVAKGEINVSHAPNANFTRLTELNNRFMDMRFRDGQFNRAESQRLVEYLTAYQQAELLIERGATVASGGDMVKEIYYRLKDMALPGGAEPKYPRPPNLPSYLGLGGFGVGLGEFML